MFDGWDTTGFKIVHYPQQENVLEVYDSSTKDGERGVFKFDSNGVLREYAFLQNFHNDASFMIDYDSTGKIVWSCGSEVVE